MFGEGSTGKRYTLTFSFSARSLLNHLNLGQPIGNLSSPLFATSNTLAGRVRPGRLGQRQPSHRNAGAVQLLRAVGGGL